MRAVRSAYLLRDVPADRQAERETCECRDHDGLGSGQTGSQRRNDERPGEPGADDDEEEKGSADYDRSLWLCAVPAIVSAEFPVIRAAYWVTSIHSA